MKNSSWIVVLVLVVLAGGAYMYRHQLKTMFMGSPAPTAMPQTESLSPAPTLPGAVATSPAASDLVMTKTSPAKGSYLVAANGMTLYIFDKDTKGVSNCSGACATLWPPYTTAAAPATLPANVTTLTRADGSVQYAYNGKPVYFYQKDAVAGDLTGDGFGGVWHLVKP